MTSISKDFRQGLRTLRRYPMTSLVAVLSLALGIGLNVLVFTLVQALLLDPLPRVSDPQSLVAVYTQDERSAGDALGGYLPVSYFNYEDFRDRNRVLSGLAAFLPWRLDLAAGDEPEKVMSKLVSANYFDVLGVEPALGRFPLPDEANDRSAQPVAVLNHAFWRSRFGGDRSVVGRTLRLNGVRFVVVGVAPEGFKGTHALYGPDLWVPLGTYRQVLAPTIRALFEDRQNLVLNLVGRRSPGVSPEQAQADLQAIAVRLAAEHPQDNEGRRIEAVPLLRSALFPNLYDVFFDAGWLLMTVVALVLIIACVNVANILLARATARRQETAVRLSLGVGRARLLRQHLVETLILLTVAAGVGIFFAFLGEKLFWLLKPPFIRRADIDLSLGASALLFTVGVALVAGLVAGLVPALRASRADVGLVLRAGDLRGGSQRLGFVGRRLLIVAQIVLSTVAVTCASLFVTSLQQVQEVDLGFELDGLALASFDLGSHDYGEERGTAFCRRLLERVESLPGVSSATLSENVPFAGGGFLREVTAIGTADGSSEPVLVQASTVGADYFATLGIPILRGRAFGVQDRASTALVAVVNQAMARRFWPGEEAVGKSFRLPDGTYQVVGVARDAKQNQIGEEAAPFFYLPLEQRYATPLTLFVRTSGDPGRTLHAVRGTVRELDRDLALYNVWTGEDLLANALGLPRIAAALFTVFGALALLLASAGVFGVTAYWVGRRRREIGVRLALGADRDQVVRLVVRQTMVTVLLGLGLGLLGAVYFGSLIERLLFGIQGHHVPSLLVSSSVLVLVTLLATWIPAWRASRVPPAGALRFD